MNIIVDNYIWFIVSGVVILLTTIGYYADKTNFGKKKLNEATDKDSLSNINKISDEMPVIPANIPIASTLNNQTQSIADITTPINEPLSDDSVSNGASINNIDEMSILDNSASNIVPPIASESIDVGPSNSDLNLPNNAQVTDDDIWKF